MGSKLPVGNGVDLHGFHRFGVPVKHVEIDLGIIRLHLQAPGIHQIILLHAVLPCDLSGHFVQGKTFFHSCSAPFLLCAGLPGDLDALRRDLSRQPVAFKNL